MKKNIRIAFASFMNNNLNTEAMRTILSQKYNVIENYENYDYFFCDDTLYYDVKNMYEILNIPKDKIKIMIALEAFFPDLNLFDYAITFCNSFSCDDRVIHIPYLEYLTYIGYKCVLDRIDAPKAYRQKDKFCNFIYGNSNGHIMREKLFYAISKYKRVDSLGSFLNNIEIKNTRKDKNWLEISIDLKQDYRFSIACENAIFPGYTSEKLLTSILAGTIPIYWGNDAVSNEFNEASFINVNKFSSLEDLVYTIKEIDENEDKYKSMLLAPARTNEQINKFYMDRDDFYRKYFFIFEQSVPEAKRQPQGCWPDYMYPNFFYTSKSQLGASVKGLISKIMRF